MSHLKWTRKTTEKAAQELGRPKIQISTKTVGRLLDELGFSLRVNHKCLESGNNNPPPRKVRDRQFKYINRQRRKFASSGNPIISVVPRKRRRSGTLRIMGIRGSRPHIW
jgi:hypothetical protein